MYEVFGGGGPFGGRGEEGRRLATFRLVWGRVGSEVLVYPRVEGPDGCLHGVSPRRE